MGSPIPFKFSPQKIFSKSVNSVNHSVEEKGERRITLAVNQYFSRVVLRRKTVHGEYIDSSMRLCSFIYTRKQYLRPRTHRLRRSDASSSTRPISPTPSVRTALRVYSSEELDNKVHSQFCNHCVIIASLEIYVTSENGICVSQS